MFYLYKGKGNEFLEYFFFEISRVECLEVWGVVESCDSGDFIEENLGCWDNLGRFFGGGGVGGDIILKDEWLFLWEFGILSCVFVCFLVDCG